MFKSIIDNISKEELEKIVNSSTCINEVAKKLGYSYSPGKNTRKKINEKINKYGFIFKEISETKSTNKKIEKTKLNIANTNVIGSIGETSFQMKCLLNNIEISRPVVDTYPYDFIINLNKKLIKIQVKTVSAYDEKISVFNLRGTTIVNGKFKHTNYSIDDCELFYLYDPFRDLGYLLENSENMNSFTIRYNNDNSKNSHYYKNFLFENIIDAYRRKV